MTTAVTLPPQAHRADIDYIILSMLNEQRVKWPGDDMLGRMVFVLTRAVVVSLHHIEIIESLAGGWINQNSLAGAKLHVRRLRWILELRKAVEYLRKRDSALIPGLIDDESETILRVRKIRWILTKGEDFVKHKIKSYLENRNKARSIT